MTGQGVGTLTVSRVRDSAGRLSRIGLSVGAPNLIVHQLNCPTRPAHEGGDKDHPSRPNDLSYLVRHHEGRGLTIHLSPNWRPSSTRPVGATSQTATDTQQALGSHKHSQPQAKSTHNQADSRYLSEHTPKIAQTRVAVRRPRGATCPCGPAPAQRASVSPLQTRAARQETRVKHYTHNPRRGRPRRSRLRDAHPPWPSAGLPLGQNPWDEPKQHRLVGVWQLLRGLLRRVSLA
jgi:hypothetical protein